MLTPDLFRREMGRMSLALDASPHQPEPTDERIAQLYADVKDLDDMTFVLACERCRKELDWFPKAKHIIDRAREIGRGLGHEQTALDAWASFRKKVSRINLDILGHNPEVEIERLGLTDLDSAMARRLGGWSHLALMPPKDLDWKSKEFQAVYGEVSDRQRTEDQLVALEPARPRRVPLLAEGE